MRPLRAPALWVVFAVAFAVGGCATLKPMSIGQELEHDPASLEHWKSIYGYFDAHGEYRRLRGDARLAPGDSIQFRANDYELSQYGLMMKPAWGGPPRLTMPRDSVRTLVLHQSRAGVFATAFILGFIGPILVVFIVAGASR